MRDDSGQGYTLFPKYAPLFCHQSLGMLIWTDPDKSSIFGNVPQHYFLQHNRSTSNLHDTYTHILHNVIISPLPSRWSFRRDGLGRVALSLLRNGFERNIQVHGQCFSVEACEPTLGVWRFTQNKQRPSRVLIGTPRKLDFRVGSRSSGAC